MVTIGCLAGFGAYTATSSDMDISMVFNSVLKTPVKGELKCFWGAQYVGLIVVSESDYTMLMGAIGNECSASV